MNGISSTAGEQLLPLLGKDFRVATCSAEDVGTVSPFRSLCCVGSTPTRAASLDDREPRRTPSWSGREPTPERSTGRADHVEATDCIGVRCVRNELVSPFPSLCRPSVSHELLAWATALSMRDGRWSSARGSQTLRERPSPEGAETPAFRARRLRRAGQLCRAIGRDPTEGRGPLKTGTFVSCTPNFCRICCRAVERAECAKN